MVDMYNILYKYAVDTSSPEYKAPLNTIYNTRRLMTPEDTAIVAPNQDTPYSYAWLDLRAEPIVVSVPPFEAERYVSLMLNDLYTYIIGYVTPRTNGNMGGDFLVAGPDWTGAVPPGVKQVFHAPTQIALAFFRTQLFAPDDIGKVRVIQDQFRVQPLSRYLNAPAPHPAPILDWVAPLDVRKEPSSFRFFAVLDWMLQFMPVLAEERGLRERLATIGVRPAPTFEVRDEATRRR